MLQDLSDESRQNGVKMRIAKVSVVANTPTNVNNEPTMHRHSCDMRTKSCPGQPPQIQTMDLTCHDLETVRQEKTTRETSQAVERQLEQISGDTILRRIARDRLTRMRHDKAFDQPRENAAARL